VADVLSAGQGKSAHRIAQSVEQRRDILDLLGHQMNHARLPLDPPGDAQHPPGDHRATKMIEDLAPDHDIDDPGLIFQGEKNHPLGGAGPLPDEHQTGNADACAGMRFVQARGDKGGGRSGPGQSVTHENKNRTQCEMPQLFPRRVANCAGLH